MEPETKPSLSARISFWRQRLRYTLAAIYDFFAGLISKFHPPHEHPTNSVPPQDSTSDARNHGENISTPPVRVVIDAFPPAPAPTKEQETKRERDEWRARWKFRMELAGFFVICIYTYVSCNQWKTAEKQLEVSERPWITVDVGIGGDFTFEKDGQGQFRGAMVLKNIGHSPAIGIDEMYLVVVPREAEIFVRPVEAQTNICEPFRKRKRDPRQMSGITILFPEEKTTPLPFSISISKEEIDNGSRRFADEPNSRYIAPVLVGCVDYRFSFAPDEHHQTGFIYDLGRYDSTQKGWEKRLIKVGTNLPPNQLILDRYFFGGHYAD